MMRQKRYPKKPNENAQKKAQGKSASVRAKTGGF
jgi:hypothetical protein